MAYVSGRTAVASGLGPRSLSPSAEPFDPRALAPKPGLVPWLVGWILDDPRWVYALLRRFAPILTFSDWALVTRYDDVTDMLKRDQEFAVPFGPKIELLNGGPNFLLGMSNGSEYRRVHDNVTTAFRPTDNAQIVAPMCASIAAEVVERSGGRLDAIASLITFVPTLVCERHYGVPVADETRFAQLTIAMSTFMFGDPTDDPTIGMQAIKAGEEFRPIIQAGIDAARADRGPGDTIVKRLLAERTPAGEPLPNATIASILIGMVTGFVPTNTMAAGHMLEMLLRRPAFMRAAVAAALADDDEALWRCLWESFRFMPLNPGPFRVCAEDAVVAAGERRAKTLPKGTKLLAGTHSAMFDPRRIPRPNAFDPARQQDDYLMFGLGLHWCVGAPLAEAQITQTLKPLLKQKNLRRAPGRAGQLVKFGPFPAHMSVEFDPA
jgi:cytochrome P450